ncbi:hypothetical protein HMI55_006868, partial [Coelomomyces lativittatus]
MEMLTSSLQDLVILANLQEEDLDIEGEVNKEQRNSILEMEHPNDLLLSTSIPQFVCCPSMFELFFKHIQALKEKFKAIMLEKEKLTLENQYYAVQLEEKNKEYTLLQEELILALESKESSIFLQNQAEVQIAELKKQIEFSSLALNEKINLLETTIQERDFIMTWKNQLETSLFHEMTRTSFHERKPTMTVLEMDLSKVIHIQTNDVMDLKSTPMDNDPILTSVISDATIASSSETLCDNHQLPMETEIEKNDIGPIDTKKKDFSNSFTKHSKNEKGATPFSPYTPHHGQSFFSVSSKSPKKKNSALPSNQEIQKSTTSTSPFKSVCTSKSPSHLPTFMPDPSSLTQTQFSPSSFKSSHVSSTLAIELRHAKAELQHVQDQLQVLYGQLAAALSNNEALESQIKKLQMTPHPNYCIYPHSYELTNNEATSSDDTGLNLSQPSVSSFSTLKKEMQTIQQRYHASLKENEKLKQDLNSLQTTFQHCLQEKEVVKSELKVLQNQEKDYLQHLEECMQHKTQLIKKYETEQHHWIDAFQSIHSTQSELKQLNTTLTHELHKLKETQTHKETGLNKSIMKAQQAIHALTLNKDVLEKELAESQQLCNQLKDKVQEQFFTPLDTSDMVQTLKSEFLLLEKSYLAQIEHLQRELYLMKESKLKDIRHPSLNLTYFRNPTSIETNTVHQRPKILQQLESMNIPSNSTTLLTTPLHHAKNPPHTITTKVPNQVEWRTPVPSSSLSTSIHGFFENEHDPEDENEHEHSLRMVSSFESVSKESKLYPMAKALMYLRSKLHQYRYERDHHRSQLKFVLNKMSKERHLLMKFENMDWIQKVRGYKFQLKKQALIRDALVQQKMYLTNVIREYQQ